MKIELIKAIASNGIYTGAQAIKATGISMSTFYKYVREGKIPKHKRLIDDKTVFHGHELIKALTSTNTIYEEVEILRPQRGRPKKQANP